MISYILLVLIVTSYSHGYIRDYKAFDNCGYNGWTCGTTSDGIQDVTYRCNNTTDKNGRFWAWTARIPSSTESLTISNCHHVELHLDCTQGSRSYKMKQLRIINVEYLEILNPLRPRVFLHDNDDVWQAPVKFILQNIGHTSLPALVFDDPGGRCNYKNIKLEEMDFSNVTIDNVWSKSIRRSNMKSFIWKNVVVVKSIAENAIDVRGSNGSFSIVNSNFSNISTNGITATFSKVTLDTNIFDTIDNTGIVVVSDEFNFKRNVINEIKAGGFKVKTVKANIENNTMVILHTGAWQNVGPGILNAITTNIGKFTYNFINNMIKHADYSSLHMDWSSYADTCHKIILTNNSIDCNCVNVGWLRQLGIRMQEFRPFYTLFLENNNTCGNQCRLSTIMKNPVCDSESNLQETCSKEKWTEVGTDESTKEPVPTTTTSTTSTIVVTKLITATSDVPQPVESQLSVSETNSDTKTTGVPMFVWLIVQLVIIVLASSVGYILFRMLRMYQNNKVVHVRRITDEHGYDDMAAVLE